MFYRLDYLPFQKYSKSYKGRLFINGIIHLYLIMRFLFCCLFFVFLQSAAQQKEMDILDQLAAKLLKQYQTEAKERIVLQTDKVIYRAGSSIWFKAYSFSSNGYSPYEKARVIIVELVDESDSVVDRALLHADSLQYQGSLSVPVQVSGGYYHIRAWTKAMLRDSPSDIFIQPVYISSSQSVSSLGNELARQHTSVPRIYFYPEGNNLINGVSCTVVYTATDSLGNPIEIEGTVRENNNRDILNFRGSGIGQFTFEPYSKDRTYQVVIKDEKASQFVFSLPAISAQAYQLALQEQTNDKLIFRVALGDSLYKRKAASYLVGIASGKICFASAGTGMYTVQITTDSMPYGIADFYLFDEQQQIVSRRSVFIERSSLVVNLTTDRADYLPRQKVQVGIRLSDKQGHPVKATLSVSVTDDKLASTQPALHPADPFFLQPSSRGIWVPDILQNNNIRNLWLVVQSQNEPFFKALPGIKMVPDFYGDGLQLKGRVFTKQKTPVSNELVTILPEQGSGAMQVSTDQEGRFHIRDLAFYGKQRFFVLVPAYYNKGQYYEVTEEPVLFPFIRTASLVSEAVKKQIASGIPDFEIHRGDSIASAEAWVTLQKIVLESTINMHKKEYSKKGLNAQRITAERLDKLNLSTTADAVKMLPGVIMMNGRLTIRGGLQSLSGSLNDVEPLLLVDGVPVNAASVVDYLNSIPPSQIEYIEVLTGPEAALYGTRGGNGAIVVKTTNQIRLTKNNPEKSLPVLLATGFYLSVPFYEPPYENDSVRDADFTDNRATLYWNDQLITDASGKTGFSFYTNDLKNDCTITVQGISEKGEWFYKKTTVKKR